jgi:hypothetical protein
MKFPSHLTPNEEKGKNWILQYVKAAWSEYNGGDTAQAFFTARDMYHTIKEYALGNQSIDKYKPLVGVDSESNETWLNIDWSVLPIIPRFRRMALAKLKKVDYNVVATPIDPQSNEEQNSYIDALKKKVLMREMLSQMEGVEMPRPDPADPVDMEEIDMVHSVKYKHKLAMEMEQMLEMILFLNDYEETRKQLKEDLFDYGVGALKDYLDSNGAIKVRRVNPANFIINHCHKRDFSDIEWAGEVLEMTIADLKQSAGDSFSDEDYETIAQMVSNKYGNPSFIKRFNGRAQVDDYKIRVLDFEFFSFNSLTHEERYDKRGNKIYRQARKIRKTNKYHRTDYKVVYTAKWIVGSDHIYDYGLQQDMKRDRSNLAECELSYHVFSPDFYNMRGYGIMQQIIPLADQIQIAWYKLQNAIAEARPRGIMIEMSALEDIPLGSGGKQLTPSEVLDLYGSKGVLVYRKVDISGRPTNYRPIEELENGIGRDVMTYYGIIEQNINMVREITGLNAITDGSSPDPRTLTHVAQIANEATNNSLYNIIEGDRHLLESLCQSLCVRIQDAAKYGTLKGYVRGVGKNTIQFIEATKELSNREFGIRLEDKPTDIQKERLQQLVNAYLGQDILDITDAIEIENATNFKMAQQLLAYRTKRRRAEKEAQAMQNQQANAQMQAQAAQAAEQAKQQTLQIDFQVKAELEKLKSELEMEKQRQRYEFEMQIEMLRQGVKQDIHDNSLAVQREMIGSKSSSPKVENEANEVEEPGEVEESAMNETMQPMLNGNGMAASVANAL